MQFVWSLLFEEFTLSFAFILFCQLFGLPYIDYCCANINDQACECSSLTSKNIKLQSKSRAVSEFTVSLRITFESAVGLFTF